MDAHRPAAARASVRVSSIATSLRSTPEQGTFARFDEQRFGEGTMLELARAAMPDVPVEDASWLSEYDAHYYDLRGARPLPVLRVQYADANRTWLYVDPDARRHRAANRRHAPASPLALSGTSQPRFSGSVLQAPALGHRGHRAEHRWPRAQRDDPVAGLASSAQTLTATGPRGRQRSVSDRGSESRRANRGIVRWLLAISYKVS